jgi:adenylate cyclase
MPRRTYIIAAMNEAQFSEIAAWLTQAGLTGEPETAILDGFCARCREAGLPLARALVLIDTLHPVYEGRLVRWGHDAGEAPLLDYGRTNPVHARGGVRVDAEAAAEQAQAAERWRRSPFYHMLETGETLLRQRLTPASDAAFSTLADFRTAGMTDYVAIINRFAAEGALGDMDCVYSSWTTRDPQGFDDAHVAALERMVPFLALAIKSVALTRVAANLMHTYLGRDAGARVLSGRIMRGVAERIEAAIWFSDLRGFTRITDTAPEQVIPLLDDYADVVVSAIHEHGGDVLKLIGDGTLTIFTGGRESACAAALSAAIAAQRGVAALNQERAQVGLPVTDLYLGLHIGEVFYGNVGSRERLDFTVIGPAVNETSRIAAMCRSVEQPVLVSDAFAKVGDNVGRLVSVGRYALRGVERPQELFTLDVGVG